ncbi:MAG TPA: hypothetical protein VHD63_16300 [Ktedonobacteraceae bacterium]|nr:hypothetical protein [Ktedonobacteraceae bacterium]
MAIQPPTTSPGTPPPRAKKARLSNWNMGIARTHRLTTQLVGMQLSGANLLALTVSAASVVAGTVSLVAQKYPGNWPLLLSAGVIGLGLALLIEGLTLGSLIRIRLANRAIRLLDEQIEQDQRAAIAALPLPDPALPNARQAMRQYRHTIRLVQQDARRKRQHATSLPRRQRRFSLPFAAMGALCSAAAGGLFYHTILAGLGQMESLALALLFPLVVTGTFVSSELHKDAQEEAIKEGFGGGALTETAIREETKLRSALAVHQHVLAYLEKPEAEQAIEAGARFLLHDILTELRDTSRQVTQQVLFPQGASEPTRQLPPARQVSDATSPDTTENGETTPAAATTDNMSPPVVAPDDMTSPDDARGKETTPVAAMPTGDMTSPGATAPGGTTRPPATVQDHDPPPCGWETINGTTGRRSAVSSTRPHATRASALNDAPGLLSEERQDAPSDARRHHDTTDASRPRQAPSPGQHTVVQHDAVADDTTTYQDTTVHPGRPSRAQTAQGEEPAPRPAAATPDALTTQILAYQMAHDTATQREIAQALGVAVRTVQRRLAAWKRQQKMR